MVEQRELRVQQMTWEAEGVLSVRLTRIESDRALPGVVAGRPHRHLRPGRDDAAVLPVR